MELTPKENEIGSHLSLSEEEALQLIGQLSSSLLHARRHRYDVFTKAVIVTENGNSYPPALMTKWYPATIPPYHAGMYQSLTRDGVILWRYWTGNSWGWGYENKRWAYLERNASGATQIEPWRGTRHD